MSCITSASRLLIISSFFIRFFLVSQSSDWIKYTMAEEYTFSWNITQGIVLLLFPLFGWIADLYSLHYKMIRLAFILVAISALIMFLTAVDRLFLTSSPSINSKRDNVNLSMSILILVCGLGGLGIYEANVIQFGMRQLLEAPSEQLSKFVHWYFWAMQLSPLLIYYMTVLEFLYFMTHCKIKVYRQHENVFMLGLALLLPSLIQTVMAVLGIIFIQKTKSQYDTALVKINPFKTVVRVLKYALKHKYPTNRSSLTYWENSIPSRMDYGKQKYGGPFTNEEVDDTKTFLRLLSLLVSLFGFFLQGNGHSLALLLVHKLGCPPVELLIACVLNPNHIALFTIIFTIPVYQFIVRRTKLMKYFPSLLYRIWIGMVCCLVRAFIMSLFGVILPLTTSPYVAIGLNKTAVFMKDTPSPTMMCIMSIIEVKKSNDQCGVFSPGLSSDSYLFYLLMVPQFVHGLSFVLVFMTVLEFICAQAPHTMKGLLIGIWYALFSLQYLGINSIELYAIDMHNVDRWCLYNGVTGLLVFVSLTLYSLLMKFYRYRERNEVVNEQAIIEEQYERELLHNCRSNANNNISYDSFNLDQIPVYYAY